jgi:ABC-2 type transport system ATP-binding protein
VKNVSFSVGEGEMVGLLGPNGAGKTTTIKCILGLVKPDSGRIEVEGVDARLEPRKSAAKLAAVLEGARNTYWRLTVWENIVYFAGIHGIPVSRGGEYFKYLLSVLKLEDQEDVEVRKLSSGYKQKTAVACALAKRTPIVFLDEPTLGLDVEASYDLGRRSGSSSPRKEGQWSSRATT